MTRQRWQLTTGALALILASVSCAMDTGGTGSAGVVEEALTGSSTKMPVLGGQGAPSGQTSLGAGPLLTGTPNVYYIWYGNWTGSTTPTILTDFINNLGGSKLYAINESYFDRSDNHISNALHYAGSTNDNYSQGTTLSDANLQSVVSRAITTGGLPLDANAVYVVLTSSDVTEQDTNSNFGSFCSNNCGYHNMTTVNGTHVAYAFVGDASVLCPAGCIAAVDRTNSPNANPGADAAASVIFHELSEAVTDPDGSSGWQYRENADQCAWNFGTTYTVANGSTANIKLGSRDYLLQQQYVNVVDFPGTMDANGRILGTGYCAQRYGWVQAVNGPTVEFGDDAPNGAIVYTGIFSGTFTDPGGVAHSSLGSNDVFVTMLNGDATHAWTKTFGTTTSDVPTALKVAADGTVAFTWNPNSDQDNLTKLSATGTTVFSKSDVYMFNRDIAIASDGTIYTCGGQGGDSGPFPGAIVRHSASGTLLPTWFFGEDSTGLSGSADCQGIAIGPDGSIVIAGEYSQAGYFNPFSKTANSFHTPVGSGDSFITKINSNGTWAWTTVTGNVYFDAAQSIAVAADSSIYILGYFAGSMTIGSTTVATPAASDSDLYVAKLTSAGAFSWATSVPKTVITRVVDPYTQRTGHVSALPKSAGVLITGKFSGTADFNPSSGVDNHNSANGSVFVTKLKADKSYGWTYNFGGTSADGLTLATSKDTLVSLFGTFSGTANFGTFPNDTYNKTGTGFAMKFPMPWP